MTDKDYQQTSQEETINDEIDMVTPEDQQRKTPAQSMSTISSFMIGRSCNELQANLVMIEHHYVAFNHKIPNQNNMSIVKLKSICVWISH
jgi:hypothetical protein